MHENHREKSWAYSEGLCGTESNYSSCFIRIGNSLTNLNFNFQNLHIRNCDIDEDDVDQLAYMRSIRKIYSNLNWNFTIESCCHESRKFIKIKDNFLPRAKNFNENIIVIIYLLSFLGCVPNIRDFLLSNFLLAFFLSE